MRAILLLWLLQSFTFPPCIIISITTASWHLTQWSSALLVSVALNNLPPQIGQLTKYIFVSIFIPTSTHYSSFTIRLTGAGHINPVSSCENNSSSITALSIYKKFAYAFTTVDTEKFESSHYFHPLVTLKTKWNRCLEWFFFAIKIFNKSLPLFFNCF